MSRAECFLLFMQICGTMTVVVIGATYMHETIDKLTNPFSRWHLIPKIYIVLMAVLLLLAVYSKLAPYL